MKKKRLAVFFQKIVLLFLGPILLFNPAWPAFPPENEKVFVINSMRLLESRQYSYLNEYFQQYFPELLKKQSSAESKKKSLKPYSRAKRLQYIEKLVYRIPIIAYKQAMLNTAIEHFSPPNKLYCLRADILFLQEANEEALTNYKLCDKVLSPFYQALVLKSLQRYPESEELFLEIQKTFKSNKAVINESHLSLSFIKFKQELYSESLVYAFRAAPSLRRLKALYFNYQALKKEKLAKKTLANIKKQYIQQGKKFDEAEFK